MVSGVILTTPARVLYDLARRRRRPDDRRELRAERVSPTGRSLRMSVPEGLYYTEEHEWVCLENNVATVGITDYAQSKLGDIVFVELPEQDTELDAGDTLASIESVKAASEIFSPVGGKVIEVNEELGETPGTVNKDPYGDGWIARLSVTDASEVEGLMDATTYEESIDTEDE
jgi:glycine cleavage system H protein